VLDKVGWWGKNPSLVIIFANYFRTVKIPHACVFGRATKAIAICECDLVREICRGLYVESLFRTVRGTIYLIS